MKIPVILVAILGAVTGTAISSNQLFEQCPQTMYQKGFLSIKNCSHPLELTSESFKNFSKDLSKIYFENVQIESIAEDVFDDCNKLGLIRFRQSTINKFPSLAINDKDQLFSVRFIGVTFSQVPIIKSEALLELIFAECHLTKLPNLSFLPSLNYLNLTNNNIDEIDVKSFSALSNLEELVLSYNQIKKLPSGIFQNNTELNTLILNNNPLKSFQVDTPLNIEVLSLKSCNISAFDKRSTKNIEYLTDLNLSFNNLTVLPIDTFESLESLEVINLANNKLEELDDDIFAKNIELDVICLDNNKFTALPKFKAEVRVFETSEFSCKNCNLDSVNGAFTSMPNIEIINLSDNKISNVSGVFDKMYALRSLDLSNNEIESIEVSTFAKYSHLQLFNLTGNDLETLNPSAFNNELSTLDLSNTGLGFDYIWSHRDVVLSGLEKLILKQNHIKKLTIGELEVTPNVKVLDLHDNPIECTESIYKVIIWLVKKKVAGFDQDDDYILSLNSVDENDTINYWKAKYASFCPNAKHDFAELMSEDPEFSVKTEEYMIKIVEPKLEIDENIITFDDDVNEDADDYDDEYDNDDMSEPNIITIPSVSYIISLTSIFVFSAVIVLIVVLSVALVVMKRSTKYHNNSPRFRVPHISRIIKPVFQEKYHNHSVYKTLTEEYDEPSATQYEFGQKV